MSTILRTQAELPEASMEDLVATWNALKPDSSVKRFSSADVGRTRVANAMLAAQDAVGHAGVSKGEVPGVKTPEEIAASAARFATNGKEKAKPSRKAKRSPTTEDEAVADDESAAESESTTTQEANMAASRSKSTRPAKKVARPVAKKAVPAKKGKAKAPRASRTTYDKVRYCEASGTRRPQEGSNRTKVMNALKKRKQATIDQLSTDVGFDARSYVHKMVVVGWAEPVGDK